MGRVVDDRSAAKDRGGTITESAIKRLLAAGLAESMRDASEQVLGQVRLGTSD